MRDNLSSAQDTMWKTWEDITTDHDEPEGEENETPKVVLFAVCNFFIAIAAVLC